MDAATLKQKMEAARLFELEWEGPEGKVTIKALTPSELDVAATGSKGFDNAAEGIHGLVSRLTRGLEGAMLMGEPVAPFSPALAALWYADNMAAAHRVFNQAMERFSALKAARKDEQKN